ncbi:MAG: tRNA lysidine(34) synthetase TilS [Nevskiaceae bacterium]|nr:MAG: tRNA lysidine(34) synthetase TilS [Nevskiaceae bacterium]TAM25118.1 MAG: tRNA lysidine(34) synthetase TilS [Nevskiaceae bacterium]
MAKSRARSWAGHLQAPAGQGQAPCLLAYSGGADSTALLHLAVEQALPGLRAVHVHHGLQAAADDWAAHCQQVCAGLGVPLEVLRVQVAADDPAGPESAARSARYAALRSRLPSGGLLLTAHHRDDQAETVLLRLLRGSGVDGLAAIRSFIRFDPGWLWRPLLAVPGAALRDYLRERGIDWIEDPHNQSPRYARSWLRQELIPRLRLRWPEAEQQLAATAARCAEAAELLAELAAEGLPAVQREDGGLSVSGLLALRPARRHLLLRHWLEQLGLPAVYDETLRHLDCEVLAVRPDAEPLLAWPGGEFRRYRDGLYAAARLPPLPEDYAVEWDGRSLLELPAGCGRLLPAGPLKVTVRLPRGGERLRLAGEAHHRSLRALAQREGLPPWVRQRLALLYVGDDLLSIAGHWHAEHKPRCEYIQSWSTAELPGLPLSWRR